MSEYNYEPLEHELAGGFDESRSEFDQVFEDMSAPEYPATCDGCGEVGTNQSMETHSCKGETTTITKCAECGGVAIKNYQRHRSDCSFVKTNYNPQYGGTTGTNASTVGHECEKYPDCVECGGKAGEGYQQHRASCSFAKQNYNPLSILRAGKHDETDNLKSLSALLKDPSYMALPRAHQIAIKHAHWNATTLPNNEFSLSWQDTKVLLDENVALADRLAAQAESLAQVVKERERLADALRGLMIRFEQTGEAWMSDSAMEQAREALTTGETEEEGR